MEEMGGTERTEVLEVEEAVEEAVVAVVVSSTFSSTEVIQTSARFKCLGAPRGRQEAVI